MAAPGFGPHGLPDPLSGSPFQEAEQGPKARKPLPGKLPGVSNSDLWPLDPACGPAQWLRSSALTPGEVKVECGLALGVWAAAPACLPLSFLLPAWSQSWDGAICHAVLRSPPALPQPRQRFILAGRSGPGGRAQGGAGA